MRAAAGSCNKEEATRGAARKGMYQDEPRNASVPRDLFLALVGDGNVEQNLRDVLECLQRQAAFWVEASNQGWDGAAGSNGQLVRICCP